jgi:hypothetical protein
MHDEPSETASVDALGAAAAAATRGHRDVGGPVRRMANRTTEYGGVEFPQLRQRNGTQVEEF